MTGSAYVSAFLIPFYYISLYTLPMEWSTEISALSARTFKIIGLQSDDSRKINLHKDYMGKVQML